VDVEAGHDVVGQGVVLEADAIVAVGVWHSAPNEMEDGWVL